MTLERSLESGASINKLYNYDPLKLWPQTFEIYDKIRARQSDRSQILATDYKVNSTSNY